MRTYFFGTLEINWSLIAANGVLTQEQGRILSMNSKLCGMVILPSLTSYSQLDLKITAHILSTTGRICLYLSDGSLEDKLKRLVIILPDSELP